MGAVSTLDEMEHIKNWCITVLDFLAVKGPAFRELAEIAKENMAGLYKFDHPQIYKGFKEAYTDINDMAKSLPVLDYQELNTLLIRKFGAGICDVHKHINHKTGVRAQ